MGPSEQPGDGKVAALAARQHGVVGRWQLLELGLSSKAIRYRVRVRRLHRIRSTVYAVGHEALGPHGRLMAAVLAYGPGALASHHAAGWMWNLRPPGTPSLHVTVPGRTRHAQEGVRLHCVRSLPDADRTVGQGVPVTTLPRTMLDLAEVLQPRQLERILEEAERLQLFDLRAVEELCARSPGRRGVGMLRRVLAEGVEPLLTRSELERLFLELCRDADLPAPSVNAVVLGYEVDAVWPDQKLVVELDGFGFHRSRAAFERDRARDAALQVAGYRVLRITARRLAKNPAAVQHDVQSLLGLGRVSYAAR